MTPQQFSVMIAINGIGLIVVSQIVALLVERIHRFKILIYLTFIQLIGVLLVVFTLILQGPLWLLLVAFFLNVCPVTQSALRIFNGYGRTYWWKWKCF